MEFEDRDIRVNKDWVNELIGLGSSGTPTTVVEEDGNREVIIGFNQQKLSELLHL